VPFCGFLLKPDGRNVAEVAEEAPELLSDDCSPPSSAALQKADTLTPNLRNSEKNSEFFQNSRKIIEFRRKSQNLRLGTVNNSELAVNPAFRRL